MSYGLTSLSYGTYFETIHQSQSPYERIWPKARPCPDSQLCMHMLASPSSCLLDAILRNASVRDYPSNWLIQTHYRRTACHMVVGSSSLVFRVRTSLALTSCGPDYDSIFVMPCAKLTIRALGPMMLCSAVLMTCRRSSPIRAYHGCLLAPCCLLWSRSVARPVL
ncbi:hypothetical protein FA95DRAFT_776284 [Auriscalpium vulgare]|uniref:Uncharacterized protein n=1 Tax=Auriscalpium vulgare TaxID=40419 RepID=A0ACB8S0G8_9AGAM|nr:hypothetical protein FA95DRAFT_776284 [Auriscalpium vulgare]